jgi:hypothetical protein
MPLSTIEDYDLVAPIIAEILIDLKRDHLWCAPRTPDPVRDLDGKERLGGGGIPGGRAPAR